MTLVLDKFVLLQSDLLTQNPVLSFQLILYVGIAAGMWGAFSKAGEPAWAAIIPIYNVYVVLKISENAWWWLLLITFIPVINLIALAKVSVDFANKFNKGMLFGLGLAFIPFVFYPILGFGGYRYQGSV
ncbi:DUF5684 domain-containing protein [Haloquadratum walsbyi]|jgi:hypothetical protein|uniref:Signal peptidase I n=1 Tax=Haloquadratum walsbyi J07HQW2 TaxID=1238425 RepID=U1NC24_9EURY|nr:DUF5684 domain-containing protein [Haloquadratum walsbyi]ERG94445.1 MAG: hypothetical protein J07HQW2_00879 [Haloquadratum walsbyi J07HQW2]